jgi:hypothetical protein
LSSAPAMSGKSQAAVTSTNKSITAMTTGKAVGYVH